MKASELRDLGTADLEQRERELDDQVFRLRLQKSMGQTEAANKMQGFRRDRARVKTILRERALEAARPAPDAPAPDDASDAAD